MQSPKKGRDRTLKVLAISSTGKWVAGGASDGTIRIWKLDDAPPLVKTLETGGPLNDLRFSEPADSLAVANRDITLIALQAGGARRRVVRDDHSNYGTVRFSADGQSLLTINGKGEILTVDVATGAAQLRYCCSSIWGEVDFAPDGNRLIWAGHWPGLWDLREGALVGRLTETRQSMTFGPIAWDTDGTVFLGSQDGRVYQWDWATRRLVRTSPAQSSYVHSIAVVGNTGWIASAAESGPIWLWNPKSGASRTVPAVRTTSNLVFDPSRNSTAFANSSGIIEFWNLVEGHRLSTVDRLQSEN
jgi:WD40 repeat protein